MHSGPPSAEPLLSEIAVSVANNPNATKFLMDLMENGTVNAFGKIQSGEAISAMWILIIIIYCILLLAEFWYMCNLYCFKKTTVQQPEEMGSINIVK